MHAPNQNHVRSQNNVALAGKKLGVVIIQITCSPAVATRRRRATLWWLALASPSVIMIGPLPTRRLPFWLVLDPPPVLIIGPHPVGSERHTTGSERW